MNKLFLIAVLFLSGNLFAADTKKKYCDWVGNFGADRGVLSPGGMTAGTSASITPLERMPEGHAADEKGAEDTTAGDAHVRMTEGEKASEALKDPRVMARTRAMYAALGWSQFPLEAITSTRGKCMNHSGSDAVYDVANLWFEHYSSINDNSVAIKIAKEIATVESGACGEHFPEFLRVVLERCDKTHSDVVNHIGADKKILAAHLLCDSPDGFKLKEKYLEDLLNPKSKAVCCSLM